MRSIEEYVQLVRDKYEEDHPVTNITMQECIDIISDRAFFDNEIVCSSIDLLRKRISQSIRHK